MPRPRIYKDNAARQAAYRDRLKKGEVTPQPGRVSVANQSIVKRVMAAEGRASE